MSEHPGRPAHSQRAVLTMPATIICANGEAFPATLRDLSSGGFRVESNARLQPGDQIDLQVGKERAAAQIRWAMGFEAGGQFDRPVVFPT